MENSLTTFSDLVVQIHAVAASLMSTAESNVKHIGLRVPMSVSSKSRDRRLMATACVLFQVSTSSAKYSMFIFVIS